MDQKKESIESISLPESISFSNGFRMFWDDLKEDSNNFRFENYVPSKEFISKYNLKKGDDGKYLVTGFLQVESNFDATLLSSIDCSFVRYTDQLNSFRIPVDKIPELVKTKGIIRVESSSKVPIK
ncbi:MAG: hypothetical protein ACK5MK_06310 [Dysgonomonas sp.]